MRLFSVPAGVIGIAVAVLFFKLYGALTRPDVPRSVATIVGQLAPGVRIGGTVDEQKLKGLTFVPHLGYVGTPTKPAVELSDRTLEIAQVRLLVDPASRAMAHPSTSKARVEAVELETGDVGAAGSLSTLFLMVFARPAHTGCVRMSDDGNFRDVQYWSTPNDRGGFALLVDYGGNAQRRYPGMAMTSLVAYSGRFEGSRTLRANFTTEACSTLAGAPTS